MGLISGISALLGGGFVYFVCTPAAPEPIVLVDVGDGKRLDAIQAAATEFDWTRRPLPAFPIPPYARFLKDVSIVIDPGHGGRGADKAFKRGPTGLREAEVNLRVARFLREFLTAAGAKVTMTRDADIFLHARNSDDLRLRVEIANTTKADLFISLHHNGAANESANYTTVFYHGEPDHSPASLAAARHVLTGLNDALRLEKHLECGVVSDYALFPPPNNNGLAVLRRANVPAILVESSFHSNPAEEERLRDPLYNRSEAYGIFLGLARWAQAGLPRIQLVEPTDGRLRSGSCVVRLDDGLSGRGGFGAQIGNLRLQTIVVKLNDHPASSEYDAKKSELRVVVPETALADGANRLYVNFENTFGQSVVHPWIELKR